jgi:hypothetical protein
MQSVSVDFFWRRVDAATAQDLDATELRGLMPHWFDEQFATERDAGRMIGVADTADLIHILLVLGAGDGPHAAISRIPVYGAAGLDDSMIGVLTPDQVRHAATFLTQASVEEWVPEHRERLNAYVGELGYHRPFSDEWAEEVAEDARALVTLFARASADGESMIVSISA